MENGTQTIYGQLELPIFQRQTAGASASPARTSASQGTASDSEDIVQVCFLQLRDLLGTSRKKIDPRIYLLRTLRTYLALTGGGDFLKLLIELDEIGYDAEWQVLNSKDFGVPQNRERVFIIGYLRGRGRREVFPVTEAGEKNHCEIICINTIGINGKQTYQQDRVYDADGISPAMMADKSDLNIIEQMDDGESTFTLSKHEVMVREATKTGYAIAEPGDSINLTAPGSKTRRGRVGNGVANTLDTSCNQGTLDGMRIRRLTPKECFRLQGWTDDYFHRAQFVNSDSQLYKQAGNGVTVSVIEAIGRMME